MSEGNILTRWWPWVRFQRDGYGVIHYRWCWTPITYRFGHGGWIYLSLPWLWSFRRGRRQIPFTEREQHRVHQ